VLDYSHVAGRVYDDRLSITLTTGHSTQALQLDSPTRGTQQLSHQLLHRVWTWLRTASVSRLQMQLFSWNLRQSIFINRPSYSTQRQQIDTLTETQNDEMSKQTRGKS